jgi:hypothetical protein
MIDEMSTAEFCIHFPEPSLIAMRQYHVLGGQVYRLLWLTGGMLPEDCRQLRGLIGTILAEVNRGDDTVLLRRIGIQLLGLAYPAIDENKPEIRDRIERILTEAGNPVDDIPY